MTEYTDLPGMPEDERMMPAELRVVREFLGLTPEWLAGHLEVSARTVRHWEAGKFAIPDGVRLEIEDLEQRTAQFIGGVVEHLLGVREPAVVTYRDDEEYHWAHPEIEFPASWHRAAIARVALEIDGLQITYEFTPAQAARIKARTRAAVAAP